LSEPRALHNAVKGPAGSWSVCRFEPREK